MPTTAAIFRTYLIIYPPQTYTRIKRKKKTIHISKKKRGGNLEESYNMKAQTVAHFFSSPPPVLGSRDDVIGERAKSEAHPLTPSSSDEH